MALTRSYLKLGAGLCLCLAALGLLAVTLADSKDESNLAYGSQVRRLLEHEPKAPEKLDTLARKQSSTLEVESDDDISGVHDLLKVIRKKKGDRGFIHAFIAALSVIVISELGDKTFFIAAIMAMRHSRVTVLLGALSALVLMTVLSALVGYIFTYIPKKLTFYGSSILFAVFGLKMLKEGWYMSSDEGEEEFEEVQADIKKREDELEKQNKPVQDIETGIIRTPGRHIWSGIVSTVFLQSFIMTFLAEWGDRSQISTIVLAAREDVWGVVIGGSLGHALCTGLAVVGGRIVAKRISVRTVTIIGGVVFILFALTAFIMPPE